MRRIRVLLWGLATLALVALGYLLVREPAPEPRRSNAAQINFGGPFTLTDAQGQTFSSSRLTGEPYAIFFGFTHCPDVCPTTLARLVRLRAELEGGDQPFSIVFVSVDPQRDRPADLRSYVSLFEEPVIGLTGIPAQIERVKRQFGIYSQDVPDESGGYTVDHTASVLLFDEKGEFVATISPEESDAVALQKLQRIAT